MATLGAGSLVVAKDGNVLAVFALDLAVIGLLFHGIIPELIPSLHDFLKSILPGIHCFHRLIPLLHITAYRLR